MTKDQQLLATVDPSAPLFIFIAEPQVAAEASWGWRESDLTVRNVRGRKMRSVNALFDELAAALQFPYYFGENWPALDECLSDMDWLSPRSGITIVIFDAIDVLSSEDPVELETFVRLIGRAASTYSRPIDSGEWWDRPPIPFHIVLQATPEESTAVQSRWRAGGAELRLVKPASL